MLECSMQREGHLRLLFTTSQHRSHVPSHPQEIANLSVGDFTGPGASCDYYSPPSQHNTRGYWCSEDNSQHHHRSQFLICISCIFQCPEKTGMWKEHQSSSSAFSPHVVNNKTAHTLHWSGQELMTEDILLWTFKWTPLTMQHRHQCLQPPSLFSWHPM